MTPAALAATVSALHDRWGPLTTERAEHARAQLAALATAEGLGPWLAAQARGGPETIALHRDPDHGFLLLTHPEQPGLYREPHDHGAGWVVYAVVEGAVEMGTWGWVADGDGARLVRRERYRMGPGDARVYLPGDIHDTRCLSEGLRMLRLTSCDLSVERAEGRMRNYPR
ncbi:MAG: hypothetical protein H6739_31530 [Alphaproteobacteria bacterium]|nr:hypothetical protein [Alphaproteobacteria bacterium]